MKRNIILTAMLSAVILTGCVSEVQSAQTERDVTASAEDAGNTETENGFSTDNISVKYFDYGSLKNTAQLTSMIK